MRNGIKTIIYGTCTALAQLFRYMHRHAPSAIVLMYHSFDSRDWRYGVAPRDLEDQLKYLHKHKHVVPLADIVAFAKGEIVLPIDAVAITVDDGYADTYEVLFPLAKAYQIPFTIFLTSNLLPQAKLGSLARPTWQQLCEMYESGLVTIEVHGHSHTNWTEFTDEDARERDISQCRTLIEHHTGYSPRYAAYPAGRRSKALMEYLSRQGFEAAVAITEGAVYAGDNLYCLRRVQVDRSMSFSLFRFRLAAEALAMVQWLRRVMR